MEIGISLLEYMTMIAAVTGTLWVAARLRRRAMGPDAHKPAWVTWGAEFFGVVALLLVCRVALADWVQVPTGSMEPTLRVGDRVLVNKLAYGPRLPFTNTALPLGAPRRGDIVVFRFPDDVSTLYVKRLVGLPGDVVSYRDGIVSINGAVSTIAVDTSIMPRDEDSGQVFMHETVGASERIVKRDAVQPGARIVPIAWLRQHADLCIVTSVQQWQCRVPEGKYLMMGDNRDDSVDSRVWGYLDASQVVGKAVKVIFNFSDADRFWKSL